MGDCLRFGQVNAAADEPADDGDCLAQIDKPLCAELCNKPKANLLIDFSQNCAGDFANFVPNFIPVCLTI